jgi:gliding motility-associated-like protein
MSRTERNIEDLFRTLFEHFTVNPTPGLWKKIQSKIAWKQFLSFNLNTFNIFYLGVAIAVAGTGMYFLFTPTGSADISQSAEFSAPEHTPPHVVSATAEAVVRNERTAGNEAPAAASKPAPKRGADRENSPEVQLQKQETERITYTKQEPAGQQKDPETAGDRTEQPGSTGTDPVNESKTIDVRVDFEANRLSGCSPLAVDFQNLSENAATFNWIFGDGGSSNEPDPSYVFDEPGDFLVTLKITGLDGRVYSRQQSIQVYETPKALFEFDEEVSPSKNQPVYFYNYSRGADYYEWDFGDNEKSNLTEPIHYYKRLGSYHIKLKVWTENQCSDSLVIYNAFTSEEHNILVPNAFTPNLNGPTGGYYEINDFDNTVFHPVIKAELLEYQLKVFNRKGVLLFESSDISIGWDGYYNEQLVKQDVYIWKIRGKFNNGKTFVKSGDVTLIKQH